MNQLSPLNKVWHTALYIRLSEDDKDLSISNSVINQKILLNRFVSDAKNDDFQVVDEYIDNGFTGTNFDRPGFIRMMEDIKAGRVNCVIVKDLSRFGREHIDVDNYLERIFPMMKVRFISVMQHLDSYKNPQKMNSIEVPFLNLINEAYARDISRKTKASLVTKKKQGKYVSGLAPYGYLIDENDKNHLVVDEETAGNVLQIFQWYVQGMSMSAIADKLNGKGILSPGAYKAKIGTWRKSCKGLGLWTRLTVRHILSQPAYTGDMVQGRTRAYNHKIKKRVPVDEEDWIVVPGTHEAIVSHDVSMAAQQLLNKNTRPKMKTKPSPLAQYIFCADCGKPMVRSTSTINGRKYRNYVCSTSKKFGKEICNTHIINEDVILEVLLTCTRHQIQCAVDLEKVIKTVGSHSTVRRTIAFLEKKLSKLTNEIERVDALRQGLYEDCKSGLLTEQEYLDLKEQYSEAHTSLLAEVASLRERIENTDRQALQQNEFIEKFKIYQGITEITRDVVVALVDKIIVHEERNIDIVFKYRDEYQNSSSILAED